MIGDRDPCPLCARRPERLGLAEIAGETWWRVRCGCGARWLLIASDRDPGPPAEPAPLIQASEIADALDPATSERTWRILVLQLVARIADRIETRAATS